MRLVSLALFLFTSLIALPAMAQEVTVNRYVAEASSERVVEVSSLDAGLWLHLAPVDRNGLVLGRTDAGLSRALLRAHRDGALRRVGLHE